MQAGVLLSALFLAVSAQGQLSIATVPVNPVAGVPFGFVVVPPRWAVSSIGLPTVTETVAVVVNVGVTGLTTLVSPVSPQVVETGPEVLGGSPVYVAIQ